MAPAPIERMKTLTHEIASKTEIVTNYLEVKGLEADSFDVNGLVQFPIPPEEAGPYIARLDLIALTKELHDIALGPNESLRYLAWDISLNEMRAWPLCTECSRKSR